MVIMQMQNFERRCRHVQQAPASFRRPIAHEDIIAAIYLIQVIIEEPCQIMKPVSYTHLSSTALQNTTSFIAFCGLRMATSLTIVPINLTASMFKPLRVLPMFTDAQTRSVVSNTSGKLFINAVSAGVLPF